MQRHSSTPRRLIALAIAQIFIATPSLAQNPTNTNQEVTEITVSGQRENEPSKMSGFVQSRLQDTPHSVQIFNAAQLKDLRIRNTSDAMKFDASVNDAYNTVGYAEQFSIRGFNLNNASSYRKDGLAIPSDAAIPLENKERIEVFKGVSGLQGGFSTPGGLINFVTKRPAPVLSSTMEISERGTVYASVDLGRMNEDKVWGYRLNAAAEKMRSYVKGADGHREFISGAFDWQLGSQALLQVDVDYQNKSQLSVSGYQLLNGTDLPQHIKPETFLGVQAWSKPVVTKNTNLGIHFEYNLVPEWTLHFKANQHYMKRDDYVAFPYGCSKSNLYPGYCKDGEYDLYDYQSPNESKTLFGLQAFASGTFQLAHIQNRIALGYTQNSRRDEYGDDVYDYVGVGNVYQNVAVPSSTQKPGPVIWRRTDKENSFFVQNIAKLSAQLDWHLGIRRIELDRSQLKSKAFSNAYTLPSTALVFKADNNLSFYANYSKGLEQGGVAPKTAANPRQILDANTSKQWELGTKGKLAEKIDYTVAIFDIRKPLEYLNSKKVYVQSGEAKHQGIELSMQGKITSDALLGFSASALNARQFNTGDVNVEGKRVSNVPHFKSTIFTDVKVAPAWYVNGNVQYASSKSFSPDNKIDVPSYAIANLGLRHMMSFGNKSTQATLRFDVQNITNRFYWKDVTQSLGGYLFPGAPRTYKASIQMDY